MIDTWPNTLSIILVLKLYFKKEKIITLLLNVCVMRSANSTFLPDLDIAWYWGNQHVFWLLLVEWRINSLDKIKPVLKLHPPVNTNYMYYLKETVQQNIVANHLLIGKSIVPWKLQLLQLFCAPACFSVL